MSELEKSIREIIRLAKESGECDLDDLPEFICSILKEADAAMAAQH